MPQGPLKLFKLANPKPAYPASPFLPMETTAEPLANRPPLSLCLPSDLLLLQVALYGVACPPLLVIW